jgi:hypothetical protein
MATVLKGPVMERRRTVIRTDHQVTARLTDLRTAAAPTGTTED